MQLIIDGTLMVQRKEYPTRIERVLRGSFALPSAQASRPSPRSPWPNVRPDRQCGRAVGPSFLEEDSNGWLVTFSDLVLQLFAFVLVAAVLAARVPRAAHRARRRPAARARRSQRRRRRRDGDRAGRVVARALRRSAAADAGGVHRAPRAGREPPTGRAPRSRCAPSAVAEPPPVTLARVRARGVRSRRPVSRTPCRWPSTAAGSRSRSATRSASRPGSAELLPDATPVLARCASGRVPARARRRGGRAHRRSRRCTAALSDPISSCRWHARPASRASSRPATPADQARIFAAGYGAAASASRPTTTPKAAPAIAASRSAWCPGDARSTRCAPTSRAARARRSRAWPLGPATRFGRPSPARSRRAPVGAACDSARRAEHGRRSGSPWTSMRQHPAALGAERVEELDGCRAGGRARRPGRCRAGGSRADRAPAFRRRPSRPNGPALVSARLRGHEGVDVLGEQDGAAVAAGAPSTAAAVSGAVGGVGEAAERTEDAAAAPGRRRRSRRASCRPPRRRSCRRDARRRSRGG